jgi:hypothetical protein
MRVNRAGNVTFREVPMPRRPWCLLGKVLSGTRR